MNVDFAARELDRLERDPVFDLDQSRDVVLAYRKRLQGIRSAVDGHDLAALASWRVVGLSGSSAGLVLVPLTNTTRMVIELPNGIGSQRVRIVRLEMAA